MFLRKLFSGENKIGWVIIDLMIVIIGVYSAYLIQDYAENQKLKQEKEEVISALKFELEQFRVQMPGAAWFSKNQATEWQKVLDSGSYVDYAVWRFIEPQYNYKITERAISIQNSAIINFELYQALQPVYRQIRRIEHAERLLTEMGSRYKSIPSNLQKSSTEYSVIWASNYDNFRRFIRSMLDRAGNQESLGSESAKALQLINEQLAPEVKRKIEESLIIEFVDELVSSEEEAVVAVKNVFPDFNENEIRQMYRKATGANSDTVPD